MAAASVLTRSTPVATMVMPVRPMAPTAKVTKTEINALKVKF